MKVTLAENAVVFTGWEAMQFLGTNLDEVATFLAQLPEWQVFLHGETGFLHIRRDYSEEASREWILEVGDWIVISPFESLHIYSDIEFQELFV